MLGGSALVALSLIDYSSYFTAFSDIYDQFGTFQARKKS
jgi:hypothetical protein